MRAVLSDRLTAAAVARRLWRSSGALPARVAPAALVAAFALCAPAGAVAGEGCPNEALREQQGSTFLPECRAYELVSPPEKNGIDIAGDPSNTQAATDGNALEFPAVGGFVDAQGTGVVSQYVSERTGTPGTQGWVTHGITPPVQASSLLNAFNSDVEPQYLGDFSADLSRGVFFSNRPLTEAPNVAQTRNLYLRTNVLDSGDGAYELLTDSFTPVTVPSGSHTNYAPVFAAASSDYTHIIFESILRLTANAPPCTEPEDPVYGCEPLLYEWSNGTVRLAGILPDGHPATNSVAGRGAATHYTQRTISADGSRVFFTETVPPFEHGEGAIFMRTNGTSTVQINASERTDCADHNPCSGTPEPDPAGPQPATFGDATPDGSQVFFFSAEQLTDQGSGGLYRYDVNAPAGHRLTLLDGASLMIGTSTDGSYVYGVVPVSGEILLWHDGVVRTVGVVSFGNDQSWISDPGNVGLALKTSEVSPDGRFLMFTSHDDPTQREANGTCDPPIGCNEVYEYDATANSGAGLLRCVSCPAGGQNPTQDANTSILRVNQSALPKGRHFAGFLSYDGKVFFDSRERLVSADTNGAVQDVYEYDPTTNTVQLISSGKGAFDSYFVEASPDGHDVFFITRDQLTGWDVDQNYDIYDARVGGGFPNPPPTAAPCAGDACQGALHGPPGSVSFGSSLATSAGDAVPASKASTRPLTRAQQLRKALRACGSRYRKKSRRRRCESAARRRFGKSGGSK